MKAGVVKYFFNAGYTLRQTAIISEVTEDYVRKIMSGKRAQSIEATDTAVTEGMRRRARVIDYVMSLKGADFVEGSQRYNYISLLSYMGYTLEELRLIFPLDRQSFIGVAALRSGEAWKNFDATLIGLPQEDYLFTFVEKVSTYEDTVVEQQEETSTYLAALQSSRKQKKLRNRANARQ
jgi:hypothetical protein